jgi:ABC-type branched-subunit amino acid transport system substrate-binding protein
MGARRLHLAVVLAAAAALAGCGGGDGDSSGPEVLTVYASLPLSGLAAPDGRDAADGARLALADAGSQAGGVTVEARFLDAGAGGQGWSPARSAANARTATRDSTAIAYVGDFQSGATRASLPITNKAFVLQVSPASGAADLVAEFRGSSEISELQTTDERTFGRVIPSDEQQGEVRSAWKKELGGRAAEVVSDAALSPYGAPSRLADGTLATSAALDPSHLPESGREFVERFAGEYGRRPGRYAAYGYEAMAVALDSIDRASNPADRQDVVEAFFETSARESILGQYSITAEGETTLGRMSGYEIRGGEARPVAELEVP